MSGPNAEFGALRIGVPMFGMRWPLRLRLDGVGVRIVCGWAMCEGALLELEAQEAEDFPFDAITLAELAAEHAPRCEHAKNGHRH